MCRTVKGTLLLFSKLPFRQESVNKATIINFITSPANRTCWSANRYVSTTSMMSTCVPSSVSTTMSTSVPTTSMSATTMSTTSTSPTRTTMSHDYTFKKKK
eukprot:Phypoly_transcript_21536.p2 GENE.Phypoly_transcript_21536~~Phypoly_transcript_21536.p2  ORF type:complete len:101 (-),score=11.99 Phypoly_transcript_21536:128-430(-)